MCGIHVHAVVLVYFYACGGGQRSTQVLALRSHPLPSPFSAKHFYCFPRQLTSDTLITLTSKSFQVHTHMNTWPPSQHKIKKSPPEDISHRELNFNIPSQLFKSSFESFPPRLLLLVCTLGEVWGRVTWASHVPVSNCVSAVWYFCKGSFLAPYNRQEHGSWASAWFLGKAQAMDKASSCSRTLDPGSRHGSQWQYSFDVTMASDCSTDRGHPNDLWRLTWVALST